ncbi:hypothetical protein MesoLjLa_66990 (plasmid) [Mesorhizobium sp. L-2-11]|nr:hypothetical protein MesoLjLa_66990 [Mesorhizobium sp. L-2-11]
MEHLIVGEDVTAFAVRSSGSGDDGSAHGFAVEFEPVSVVNEAVEDGIGVGGIRECFMMHLSLIAWSVAVGVEVDRSGRWKG